MHDNRTGKSTCQGRRVMVMTHSSDNHGALRHPTDRFGGISVRETCNRLKFSVREMSSRAFLINAFIFGEIKMTFQ